MEREKRSWVADRSERETEAAKRKKLEEGEITQGELHRGFFPFSVCLFCFFETFSKENTEENERKGMGQRH